LCIPITCLPSPPWEGGPGVKANGRSCAFPSPAGHIATSRRTPASGACRSGRLKPQLDDIVRMNYIGAVVRHRLVAMGASVHDIPPDLVDRIAAHRCVLLVDPDPARLRSVAETLAGEHRWPTLLVGSALAAALLDVPPRRRPADSSRVVRDLIRPHGPGPLICLDVDLLFEPSLQLDPLALFRDLSRIVKLVVAWPGSSAERTLAYAVPAHGHYRTWSHPEVEVIPLSA
jgi:hypothetical protein